MNGWRNESFTELLGTLRETLPEGEKLPKSSYEVKKIISELGLGYEKIHVCPNSCILFWKEHEHDDICTVCGASRWEENEISSNVRPSMLLKKKHKKAKKILRWFPVKPRLLRLFMCSKTENLMRWHFDQRTDDGYLRHPADAHAWKDFDALHKNFSREPHNIRFGLASDGFNPFRSMNVTYSTWPVVLTINNWPPWLCMEQHSFMLSLLIPSPESSGEKIDVFLQPLIDELIDLWVNGLQTYDANAKNSFKLQAALLWTINDFPAYGMLSGWSVRGKFACPTSGFGTCSKWLENGGKYCFMGHRRFFFSY